MLIEDITEEMIKVSAFTVFQLIQNGIEID